MKKNSVQHKSIMIQIPEDIYRGLLEVKPASMYRKDYFYNIFMLGILSANGRKPTRGEKK